MWSDNIPLRQLLEDAGFIINVLHVADSPMSNEGRLARIIARRHYALVAAEDAHDDAQTMSWCWRVLDRIKNHTKLERLLQSGQIEGLIWIALMGSAPLRLPHMPDNFILDCKTRQVGILVEDYTAESGDIPAKHWLARTA
jgi:hypothetical protein